MMLFFVGVLEMLIVSIWTKVVTETRVLVSGIVTVVNIIIWYYVLQVVMQDISNWQLIAFYTAGCAIGTMLSTAYFRYRDNKEASILSANMLAEETE